MSADPIDQGEAGVLCLRPERDFSAMGVDVPAELDVVFADTGHVDEIGPNVACVVLPSAGPGLPASMFRHAKGLRLIQYTGAGFDRIPRDVLEDVGCAVCNVPGASAMDVASYVVIVSGMLLRRLLIGDELVKAGRYADARAALSPERVRGFRGLRVGIIGFGGIGREVAAAFRQLGSSIKWFDPGVEPRTDIERSEEAEFSELLPWSELLTVHVPLLDSTRGLIGRRELARLSPGAILVNAARGGIVDEAALAAALDAGAIGGIALDVYSQEPLPASSPLIEAGMRHPGKVMLTPHIAGVTPEASRELFQRAWANVVAVIAHGGVPTDRVL